MTTEIEKQDGMMVHIPACMEGNLRYVASKRCISESEVVLAAVECYTKEIIADDVKFDHVMDLLSFAIKVALVFLAALLFFTFMHNAWA